MKSTMMMVNLLTRPLGKTGRDWLEHQFIPYGNRHVRADDLTQKIILFLVGRTSHERLYSIEVALKQNIEIVRLPP